VEPGQLVIFMLVWLQVIIFGDLVGKYVVLSGPGKQEIKGIELTTASAPVGL
jgi:hypothetical protein